jgi:hypothetical protein
MSKKLTFLMRDPEPKKHSTRFNFAGFSDGTEEGILSYEEARAFRPSFYIPKPFAENAPAIRVTIEALEKGEK